MNRCIAFLVFPGFQALDLAAAAAFELANAECGSDAYRIEVVSEHGGPVRSSAGFSVGTRAFDAGSAHTVLVTGSLQVPSVSEAVCAYVRGQYGQARRVASICTGAFILARSGLLEGRRATTHWAFAEELKARFPRVQVQADRIYIKDGDVWSSAGMSAGVDLALAMVEEDLGFACSQAVARKLVLAHRRSGGQSQFSPLLELQPRTDRVQKALVHAKANLHRDLSVEDLAQVVHLSPRQFSRAFKSETGKSPARVIEQLRVEAARDLIAGSDHPLQVIAARAGFGDPERMRRAFLRAFGLGPQALRRATASDRDL